MKEIETAKAFVWVSAIWEICIGVIESLEKVEMVQLILTHVPIFFLSWKTPLIPLGLGLAMMFWLRLSKRGESSKDTSVRSVGTTTATQEADRSQTINFAPVISPVISGNALSNLRQSKPKSAPKPLRKPTPNVRVVTAKIQRLAFSETGTGFIVSAQKGYDSIVVCFRNDSTAGASNIGMYGVRAHVIYRNDHGMELLDIPAGCWIDNSTDSVDLELGRSRCLVVAAEDGKRGWFAPWMDRKQHQEFPGGDYFELEGTEMPQNVSNFEIALIDANNFCLPLEKFSITESEEKISIVRTSDKRSDTSEG